MRRIDVYKPSTFKTQPGKIRIVKPNGKIFYEHILKTGYFNLPKGLYFCEKEVRETGFKRLKILIPDIERNIPFNPENIRIRAGKNRHKCSVIPGKNLVVYDRAFFQSISPEERVFILFHEFGHYKFKDELKCDIYAANEMLKIGFNPSQIVRYSLNTLGKNGLKRQFGLLKKIQVHER